MVVLDFGKKLKELRINANLTQKELAEKIHISDKVISKLENGKSNPSIDNIATVSEFFNVDIDYLVDDYEVHRQVQSKIDKKRIKKRRLPYTLTNVLLDIVTLSIILYMYINTALIYNSLPDEIGIHFNGSGQIDGYGSKNQLFVLPSIVSGLTMLTSIFHFVKIRWYINLGLPVPIENLAVSEEHARYIYKALSVVLAVMKLSFCCMMIEPYYSLVKQEFVGFVIFWLAIAVFVLAPFIGIFFSVKKGKSIRQKQGGFNNKEKDLNCDLNIKNDKIEETDE